jgi:uncharacterized protein (UPF0332 family)
MKHFEKKVKWCMSKAEKELRDGDRHRGLIRVNPDTALTSAHIRKAEHNLNAMLDFKAGGYSDWSASAAFYSVYHCLLGILAKLGYESRNQECTFALIYSLIESGLDLDKDLIEKVYSLDHERQHELPTMIEVRENEQYGLSCSLDANSFDRLFGIAKQVLDQTKNVLEQE